MTENLFNTPFGSFQLDRTPGTGKGKGRQQTLRAWDAADAYLLEWFYQHQSANHPPPDSLFVLNDQFGALAIPLHQYTPRSIGDSWLAQQACLANLASNQLNSHSIDLQSSLEPVTTFPTIILGRIPKTLALLEYQLHQLRPHLTPDTSITFTSMVKHLGKQVFPLLESLLGPVHTSLAHKKARLLFCTPDPGVLSNPKTNPYPTRWQLENTSYHIYNHANVFSHGQLDIGTRFFLQHLPEGKHYDKVIDLGCGNGIIGLMAFQQNRCADIAFVDESFMAVDSARQNFSQAFPGQVDQASFNLRDSLDGINSNSADLILNNPPFHQNNVVGDHIAWKMFKDSRRVLKPGGELWVIGNRHLGYQQKLKRIFGHCQQQAANNKFVIIRCTKS